MPRKGSRKISKKVSRKTSRKASKKSRKASRKASRTTEEQMLHMVGGDEGKAEFVHKLSSTSVKNGKVEVHEEMIVKGDKGLIIKHYHKDDKSKVKMVAKMMDNGSFSVRTMDGDKKDDKDMSKEDFLKMLAKDKNLKFAHDYLKTMKGGARRKSRKGSKKASKKRSRK